VTQALARMRAALADTLIAGTITNKAFLSALCAHDGFAAVQVDTGLIERDLDKLVGQSEPPLLAKAVAALAVLGLAGRVGGQTPGLRSPASGCGAQRRTS
jgi:3-methylcrotonyl-CoA carboxylase alpha subunit